MRMRMWHAFITEVQIQIQIQTQSFGCPRCGLQRGRARALLRLRGGKSLNGAVWPAGDESGHQADPLHTATLIHTCPGPSAAAAAALPPSLCGPVAMIRCFFDLSSAAWGQNSEGRDEMGS